jgi:GAF domain-containing protein
VAVPAVRLAEVFVEVADTRDETLDLGAYLRRLASRATEVVTSDAAGVLLADHQDRLRFVAGSDEATTMLELFQLQHDEGPCLDCYRTGEPVVNTDLAKAADRWPRFAPFAVAAGFRSVHAVPLRRPGDVTVGAISLLQTTSGRLEADDIQIVQALAAVATIRLIQERTLHGAQVLTEQLQTALKSRIAIEQAKGAVAQVLAVSVDEAFALMRGYARHHHQRLSDLAQTLIDNPADIALLSR